MTPCSRTTLIRPLAHMYPATSVPAIRANATGPAGGVLRLPSSAWPLRS